MDTTRLEIEDAQTRRHLIQSERSGDRRLGAGKTALALAQPTGRPDWNRRLAGRSDLAVDEATASHDIATKQQRGSPHPLAERCPWPLLRACNGQVYRAIRHLDGFGQDLTRLQECGMDVQLRTAAAKPRPWKTMRTDFRKR